MTEEALSTCIERACFFCKKSRIYNYLRIKRFRVAWKLGNEIATVRIF